MATVNGDGYSTEVYTPKTGEMAVAYSVYDITSALSKDDTIRFFKLPQAALPVDGFLRGDDLDDDADEELEIDVGITGALTRYLDSGVLTGDALADRWPEAGIHVAFQGVLQSGGMVAQLTAEETVLGTITAAAKGAGTGQIAAVMMYTRGRA